MLLCNLQHFTYILVSWLFNCLFNLLTEFIQLREWWGKMASQTCNYEMEADRYNASLTGDRGRLEQSKMKPHGGHIHRPTVVRMRGFEKVWMHSTPYSQTSQKHCSMALSVMTLSPLAKMNSLHTLSELITIAFSASHDHLNTLFGIASKAFHLKPELQTPSPCGKPNAGCQRCWRHCGRKYDLAFGVLIYKVWISDVWAGQTFWLKKATAQVGGTSVLDGQPQNDIIATCGDAA